MHARPSTLAAILLGAATCALGSRTAAADASSTTSEPEASVEARGSPLGWEIAFGTRFPLEIGFEGALEVPFGLTARLGVGWMPRLYRNAINETAVGFGWYDDTDAALVAAALEDPFLISPSLGWRPIGGLEIYGGYVLAFLGGNITRAEAEALADRELPSAGGITEVPLSGTGHGFQIGVAYQVELVPHVALRLSLAYFQLFDSSTSIDVTVSGAQAQAIVEQVETRLDDYLRDLVTTYVKSPLLGVAVVYRF